MDESQKRLTGTGWLLVSSHRIKKVTYGLAISEGAAGRIGSADDRGSPLWLLEHRHLEPELEDGRKLDIRTGTDGMIVVEAP